MKFYPRSLNYLMAYLELPILLLVHWNREQVLKKQFLKFIRIVEQGRNSKKHLTDWIDSLTQNATRKAVQLRSILMTESDAAKGAALEKTKTILNQYLQQVDFWTQVAEPDVEGNLNYWKIDNWGERTFGLHGTLFVGAFCMLSNIVHVILLYLLKYDKENEKNSQN